MTDVRASVKSSRTCTVKGCQSTHLTSVPGVLVHSYTLAQSPQVWHCQPQRDDPGAAPAQLQPGNVALLAFLTVLL